jgi:broad specificity phosphatase PhoE
MRRRVHLVRHADALERAGWTGPDEQRPLSALGNAQAEAIAQRLALAPIARLVSSPALRCVETLSPLATRVDGRVEIGAYLGEGSDPDTALELLITDALDCAAGRELVACSHGDVIPAILDLLVAEGTALRGECSSPKAVTFTLELDDDRVVGIARTAPPRSTRTATRRH